MNKKHSKTSLHTTVKTNSDNWINMLFSLYPLRTRCLRV